MHLPHIHLHHRDSTASNRSTSTVHSDGPEMSGVSLLAPLHPASEGHEDGLGEEEKKASWIVRKLIGSMTGRIVMSSYESLRATGTTVVCLSPWGDSSPLLLPCIRFRDLAVHGVVMATGGMAAIAAPVMGPVTDALVTAAGDSILVEIGLEAGYEIGVSVADEAIGDKAVEGVMGEHRKTKAKAGVKTMTITLRYKHTVEDAALGFFRSSIHGDSSLFLDVKDYFSIGKGWFSPYLFASGRRPIIPRTVTPDVVFCHGPFLEGDYRIGETLLAQSASVISLCDPPPSPSESMCPSDSNSSLSLPKLRHVERSRTPSPEPTLAPLVKGGQRRLVMVVVGLKPHRKLWSTSARPGESVIQYLLLGGCPAVVLPAKTGAPLLSWYTEPLDDLWSRGDGGSVVAVLMEYLDLCVDWTRAAGRVAVEEAVGALVGGAMESQSVGKDMDRDRSGIAMWRIP